MQDDERDKLYELRKLLDPKGWPRRPYFLHNGEVYRFVSDDPLEECIIKALYK